MSAKRATARTQASREAKLKGQIKSKSKPPVTAKAAVKAAPAKVTAAKSAGAKGTAARPNAPKAKAPVARSVASKPSASVASRAPASKATTKTRAPKKAVEPKIAAKKIAGATPVKHEQKRPEKRATAAPIAPAAARVDGPVKRVAGPGAAASAAKPAVAHRTGAAHEHGRDARGASDPAPVKDEQMKSDQPQAKAAGSIKTPQTATKGRNVLRIAAGERRPKVKARVEAGPQDGHGRPAVARGGSGAPPMRPRIDINPKLHSSRGILPPPDPASSKERPMSVAQKNRAAAEAAFLRVAPSQPSGEPHPSAAAPSGVQNGAAGAPSNGPVQPHKSTFEMRISERDTLTTTLRLTDSRDAALSAARELALRFQLPPDQALLVKVIGLSEPGLTKLALEELLELDDRGRVRRTPELRQALDGLKSNDRETNELKELLLEKIGAFGT